MACSDLETGGHGAFVRKVGSASMVYVDPPWTQANVNSFRTKAEVGRAELTFSEFLRALMGVIAESGVSLAFIEMGRQEESALASTVTAAHARLLGRWPTVYYRRHPALLFAVAVPPVRIETLPPAPDPSGMDDDYTPAWAIEHFSEPSAVIFDPCMGRGLTAITADQLGRRFIGCELHPRRLAVALDRLAMRGHVPRRLAWSV